MYIQHKEYLGLLDQIQYLKGQISLLKNDNTLLTEQLIKERQKRYNLQECQMKNIELIQKLHAKTIQNQVDNTSQILTKMTLLDKQKKQFLQSKFSTLEKSSYTKLKDLEVKNVKTRLDYYQLNEFANKIRKIYKQNHAQETSKVKKQPSLIDILKWIKSIPGVNVNSQKPLQSSTSSTTFKKQTTKCSKLKQNNPSEIIQKNQSKSRLSQSNTEENIILGQKHENFV